MLVLFAMNLKTVTDSFNLKEQKCKTERTFPNFGYKSAPCVELRRIVHFEELNTNFDRLCMSLRNE